VKLGAQITEDHMVAAFVKAEIDSPDFGPCYRQGLHDLGRGRGVVERPNLGDEDANRIRRVLLSVCRGYPTSFLFRAWPNNVEWWKAEISLAELSDFKFCDYPSWNTLTQGTRLVGDGAANVDRIQAGVNAKIKELARLVEQGHRYPELLVVATSKTAQTVVMEGHTRSVAYLLASKGAPDPIPVLAGFSPKLAGWPFLGQP
jgi:hypothetical protein